MAESSQKTLQEKEKLLITSNFPFSYSVFKRLVLQTQGGRKHGGRKHCRKRRISPFPTVFSKDLYCKHKKTRACLGKG